ncbi:MAG: DEAD/DEAH box helicase family protein [Verrucomicrobiota bacterium]|nr:DEAD/DEAH box helicase family protein [Verrucomicrobiota bacterium]
MSRPVLKTYQKEAVESAIALFGHAKAQFDATPGDTASHGLIVKHHGNLLIEAPTGSGKTLIAGEIVERFSGAEDVVWFWFAPFKGVIGQTIAFLKEVFPGLRLRDVQDDRNVEGSRRGDVFVATWQSVATRIKDSRNVRKEGEINPSIDGLVESLRKQGMRIGAVVDEAHHSFGSGTQAAAFFHDVLRPDYTILVTATPNDADIVAFEKAMGIAQLQRVSVSRLDAVDAGLIKAGIKCAAYFVADNDAGLVDLEATALRDAVSAHEQIKAALKKAKISLVPLLLVQVDSREKSIEKVREQLIKLNFKPDQIATHTADEPDASLLALANDESREVLIFKMAVALGFDAPRAFTLVTTRSSKDVDFGVQLVGRILRVHRRLQGKTATDSLPDILRFGYVFLADPETQTGLEMAGQRINQIRTAYAKVAPSTQVMQIGGKTTVRAPDARGQFDLFSLNPLSKEAIAVGPSDPAQVNTNDQEPFKLDLFFTQTDREDPKVVEDGNAPKPVIIPAKEGRSAKFRYSLKSGVPCKFKTERIPSNFADVEEECANLFMISTKELFEVMRNRIPVERRTLDVFGQLMQSEFNFAADLSPDNAARLAYHALKKSEIFDARELQKLLLKKIHRIMSELVMPQASDPVQISHFLNVILAVHPELLHKAQKAALAKTVEVCEADAIPEALEWDEPLERSMKNVYGVMPPTLNSWEREFAQLLDQDRSDTVLWWHRNLPRKEWSINTVLPDGRGFYPDFIVGIQGRRKEDNGLLVDPKFLFEISQEAGKVQTEHTTYGRIMIVHRLDNRWVRIGWDAGRNKATVEGEFYISDAAGF